MGPFDPATMRVIEAMKAVEEARQRLLSRPDNNVAARELRMALENLENAAEADRLRLIYVEFRS